MSDLQATIHNERTKLTATWLNGLAIALLAIGGFAPFVSFISSAQPAVSIGVLGFVGLVCLFMSAGLHLVARKVLGRLKP